jgi:hypothetical protein
MSFSRTFWGTEPPENPLVREAILMDSLGVSASPLVRDPFLSPSQGSGKSTRYFGAEVPSTFGLPCPASGQIAAIRPLEVPANGNPRHHCQTVAR